jgi:hypothetical protein
MFFLSILSFLSLNAFATECKTVKECVENLKQITAKKFILSDDKLGDFKLTFPLTLSNDKNLVIPEAYVAFTKNRLFMAQNQNGEYLIKEFVPRNILKMLEGYGLATCSNKVAPVFNNFSSNEYAVAE